MGAHEIFSLTTLVVAAHDARGGRKMHARAYVVAWCGDANAHLRSQ